MDFGDLAGILPLYPKKEDNRQKITAKDARLKEAELIVSSPYTRALQTAQILSRETGIRVEVDIDLHEWIPDENNQYETSEESFAFAREFTEFNGEYPPGKNADGNPLAICEKE